MKFVKHLSVAGVMTLLAVRASVAQTNVSSAAQPTRNGTVVVADRPNTTDAANVTAASDRPSLNQRPTLPPEVEKRIEQFKDEAHKYLAKQEALKKQLQGANDKERAAIRERLKELREQWTERAKELRKEYKERQAELADKLSEYRELLNDARSTAIQDAGGRTRRGED